MKEVASRCLIAEATPANGMHTILLQPIGGTFSVRAVGHAPGKTSALRCITVGTESDFSYTQSGLAMTKKHPNNATMAHHSSSVN
jgi:hypothetical protein